MDKKSEKELRRITAEVPKELAESLSTKTVDTSQEDLVRRAIADPSLSQEKKRELSTMMERGAFREVKEEINQSTVKKLDEYYEKRIADARKRGLLSDPKKDRWIQEREARLRKMRR